MFFYVYILESKETAGLYVGITNDLRKRVEEHNRGLSEYTKRHTRHTPWHCVHYEAYRNEGDAKRRERYLKTTAGKRILKKMLRNYFYQPTK